MNTELTNWQENSIIHNTEINASNSSTTNPNGSCLIIRPQSSGESPNPTIQGFMIKNGKGTLLREELDFDGGIMQSNIYGGGLVIINSSATIRNNIFQNNGSGNEDLEIEMGGAVFAYSGDGMGFEDFVLTHPVNQDIRNSVNFIENKFEGNYANIGKTVSSKTDSETELNLTFTGCIFDYAFDDGANGKVSDYWCKSDGNSTIQFNSISGLSNSVSTDLYVSNDGLETNDGTENNPLGTIKSAMERMYVPEGDNLTINLEAGTYIGDRSSGFPIQALNRVVLKGSNGIEGNPTILDGTENTTLIKAESVDGFKIESAILMNGKASSLSEGGGSVNIKNSTIEFENVQVKESQSPDKGGAVFGLNSTIEIKDSYLSRNSSDEGGAIYLASSNLVLENSHIEESEAQNGGAFYIENNSTITIQNSKIENSIIDNNGGAVYSENSIIHLNNNSEIKDNVSLNYGGGLYLKDSEIFSENSEIKDNWSVDNGAGIYLKNSSFNINNMDVNHNFSENKGGAFYLDDSEGTIENSVFEVNDSEDYAGALNLIDSDVSILNTEFIENSSGEYAGAINIDEGTVHLENVFIFENEGEEFGGGIVIHPGSDVTIKNSKLIGNETGSGGFGGAIQVNANPAYQTNLRIEKSTIAFNKARETGGGIHCNGAKLEIINSNIIDNTINSFMAQGGGIYLDEDSELTIINSILWQNEPEQIFVPDDDVEILIDYSNIMNQEYGLEIGGDELILGEANIDQNPLFTDIENFDFTLMANSPCIDAGIDYYEFDEDIILNLSAEDFYNNAPDIGAIEYGFLSVNDNIQIPTKLEISEAYPNPFNPSTTFKIYSPKITNMNILIYNIQGQLVNELSDNSIQKGTNKINLDLSTFSTGLYIIHFFNQHSTLIKKITLIK